MVEHAAVNRGVVGSSPTRGVFVYKDLYQLWLRGQEVKTSPFHGGNTGSIPVGVTLWRRSQVVRQWSATPVFTGSNPVDALQHNCRTDRTAVFLCSGIGENAYKQIRGCTSGEEVW